MPLLYPVVCFREFCGSMMYERYDIQEEIILPEMVHSFDEMFVTNSLLGIMPVRSLEDFVFPGMEMGRKLLEEYRQHTGMRY